jgi:hypothetical protein
MCSIAGILDNNSKTSPESLSKALQMMLDALEHRASFEVPCLGFQGMFSNYYQEYRLYRT